jgi:hypothetical protein
MQRAILNKKLRHGLMACAITFGAWLSPRAGAALVDLEMLVTPLGGSYQYDVTIRNNSLVDLTLVSIVNAPIGDPLINPSLIAPAGFVALYDSGLGIIDFLEGASVFGVGQTIGGFRFVSSVLPGPSLTLFEALDVNGGSFSGSITSTVVPGGSVPDSGSTVMLAAFAFVMTALGHARRRTR